MKFVIDLLYLVAAVALTPIVLYRMLRYKRYRTGWQQRFGKILRKDPAMKKCIWLHAVSVGEVNATRTIIEELRKKFPEFEIAISTTTDTGFARATSLFSNDLLVFYFPLDFSSIMNRAFRNIQPAICLLMELEVWPNFIQTAKNLNTPIVIVNGRISEQSLAKYKKIKPIAKAIFKKITLTLAQTNEYARRFIEIGCPEKNVLVTGSLKYDTAQITDKVAGTDELAAQLNIKNEILWVAGATGNDEEKIILDVYQNLKAQDEFKNLQLAIVPRKPERFDEVAQLIEQTQLPLIRYSQARLTPPKKTRKSKTKNQKSKNNPVILGDTMGDLRKFYSLADIIFVGRTLVPMGGSDMVEAAALGKCTIFGPHAFNFKQTVDALLADEGAIMVNDRNDLLETLKKCLSEPKFAEKIAKNGQNVIRKNQGATQRTIEEIAKLIKG